MPAPEVDLAELRGQVLQLVGEVRHNAESARNAHDEMRDRMSGLATRVELDKLADSVEALSKSVTQLLNIFQLPRKKAFAFIGLLFASVMGAVGFTIWSQITTWISDHFGIR